MKWIWLLFVLLITCCSQKENTPPEISISLPFADNGSTFNGQVPSFNQIRGIIKPGSEGFPSYVLSCAEGRIKEISDDQTIIEHSLEGNFFYSIYSDIRTQQLSPGANVSEKELIGQYRSQFKFILCGSPDFKQVEDVSEIMDLSPLPPEYVSIEREVPDILIINPCKNPLKLSMVQPVVAILNEYTRFSPRVIHYLDRENLGNPDFIIITGQSTPWEKYNLDEFDYLKKIITEGNIPVLGICGGHQLIALLSGGTVDLVKPGNCPKIEDYRGCFKVRGPVEVCFNDDMLFTGYRSPHSFFASHCEHITSLPEQFTQIAETSFSNFYAFKHRKFPVYGVQFHPELPANDNSMGRNILFNFIVFAR